MSRWDTTISASAWDRLVSDYRDLGEDADDREVAELLRDAIQDVEG